MAEKLSDKINALPDDLRAYIHELEMNSPIAGYVQEIAGLKENVAGLVAALEKSQKGLLTGQMKLALNMIREMLCEVEDYCNRRDGKPFYYLMEKSRLTIDGFNMAFGGILPERGRG